MDLSDRSHEACIIPSFEQKYETWLGVEVLRQCHLSSFLPAA